MARRKQELTVTMMYVAVRHYAEAITGEQVYERVRGALHNTNLEFATAIIPNDEPTAAVKPRQPSTRVRKPH